MTTASTAQDPGQASVSTAADEGKHVGGVAAREAQSVAGDVKAQARNFLDDTRQQVSEQASVQRDRLVELLRSLSHDLRDMADHASDAGLARQLVHQGADRAERIGSSIDRREPADLLEDVRTFARRKPGVFLAGALVAGVVAGRFARGVKDSGDSGSTGLPDDRSTEEHVPVPEPVTGPIDVPDSRETSAADTGMSSYGTASRDDVTTRGRLADTP